MARNVQFQVLRGLQGDLSSLQASANPLALGEMFFATDTSDLFFGIPGVGIGYIQIGDVTQVNERLDQLIVIMECVRRALVQIACQEAASNEIDFDPATISQELAARSPIGR
ncbi:MAG TPA: hypothetical protein VJY15_13370 [Candidatus Acidoferrum sp.]|nr:hypothetical protein [Candidatus Acidoferrum sp.]